MAYKTATSQEKEKEKIILSHDRHFFDPELAAKIGIPEAIVVQHFIYWITINKRANKNFFDGNTWTYQTLEEISNHFPYFTPDQIRDILYKLINGKTRKGDKKLFEPILKIGNYNKSKFDRTSWYAFENEELFIKTGSSFSHLGKSPNGLGEIPTPIPHNNNTYIKKEMFKEKREIEIELSEKEKNKLIEKIGKDKTEAYIVKLKNYLNSIGQPKKYKSHYHTILVWYQKDNEKNEAYQHFKTNEEQTIDKKLREIHLIYKKWYEQETNDISLINKGFLEIHEKFLKDKNNNVFYKKTIDMFFKVLQEKYYVPFYIINKMRLKLRETAQISSIATKSINNPTYIKKEK